MTDISGSNQFDESDKADIYRHYAKEILNGNIAEFSFDQQFECEKARVTLSVVEDIPQENKVVLMIFRDHNHDTQQSEYYFWLINKAEECADGNLSLEVEKDAEKAFAVLDPDCSLPFKDCVLGPVNHAQASQVLVNAMFEKDRRYEALKAKLGLNGHSNARLKIYQRFGKDGKGGSFIQLRPD